MPARLTQQQFIDRSSIIFNNFYDYSEFEYANSITKSKIICPTHGGFWQTPVHHLRGHGCKKCGFVSSGNKRKITLSEFVKRSTLKHNGLYDYSCTVISDKVGGDLRTRSEVNINCPIHGVFIQMIDHHMNGIGCPECGGTKNVSESEFLERCKIIHGNKFDYILMDYKAFKVKIKIICPDHGVFSQTPYKHLSSKGCPYCGKESQIKSQTMTLEEFVKRSNIIHDGFYSYFKSVYVTSKDNITITCPDHGDFAQIAGNHLSGVGCPKCALSSISKAEINWLNSINILEEYRHKTLRINGKRYYVDAYNSSTNTIYEFYGDYWHGNPKKYKTENINEMSKKTFGDLYAKTIAREVLMKQSGYNLITIWESDFKNI